MTRTTSKASRTRGADYQAPTPVPKAKRTRGRPSEYDEAYLPEACEYARQGMTDVEIAEAMGVEVRTLYRWFAAYPQLRQAVRSAKDLQDDQVESSLLHQAKLGNTTAQIFWLKNRRPQDWRDRKETELIVPMNDDNQVTAEPRSAALAALALFDDAVYSAPLIEMTANAEENAHGRLGPDDPIHDGRAHDFGTRTVRGDSHAAAEFDPDFDVDPGEL